MSTKNKIQSKILFVIVCLTFSMPIFKASASSGVVLNEVMYAPSGTDDKHEWIEFYNSGSQSVDLSNYHLQTDGASGSHHSLSPQSSGTLAPLSYAVITQDALTFMADYPNFSGLIFDSSWSDLTNTTGKTLIILDENDTAIDTFTYNPEQGASDDGNSLQKNGSSWIASLPTPGVVNNTLASTTTTSSTDTNSTDSKSQKVETDFNPKIIANIVSKSTAMVGVANVFDSIVYGYSKDILKEGRYNWNFGDGTTEEYLVGQKFEHTYLYPGDYVVYLEYRRYYWTPEADSVDRFLLKVITPSVVISNISPDGGVEISNESSNELDLSNWQIVENGKIFSIYKNTIILPKQKIIFRPIFTKLDMSPDSVILKYPSGENAFVFEDKNTLSENNIQLQSKSFQSTYLLKAN